MGPSIFEISFVFSTTIICYNLIATCNGSYITFEEYRRIEGKEFCESTHLPTHLAMCKRLADLYFIPMEEQKGLNATCYLREIILFRKNGERVFNIEENLLVCRSGWAKNPHTNKFEFSFVKAVGKGKSPKDVMEYNDGNKLGAVAFTNRPDLLKYAEVITFEHYEIISGKEFCKTRDQTIHMDMCKKLADLNFIPKEQQKDMAAECWPVHLILLRKNWKLEENPEENLLHCRSGWSQIPGTDKHGFMFEKALGKGSFPHDAVEYGYYEHMAVPIKNHVDFLNDFGVITFEQYQKIKGEEFCEVKHEAFYMTMCKKLAEVYSIPEHEQRNLLADCDPEEIILFNEDRKRAPETVENLLTCLFLGDLIPSTNEYEVIFVKAIGRGMSEKDIIEYDYDQGKVVPVKNRVDFLKHIQGSVEMMKFNFDYHVTVITFEQYNQRKGKEFCNAENEPIHIAMCKKLAYLYSISEHELEDLSYNCSSQKLNLLRESGLSARTSEEVLLHCQSGWNKPPGTDNYRFTFEKALGRGILPDDVIEYEYKESFGVPVANRIDFLVLTVSY